MASSSRPSISRSAHRLNHSTSSVGPRGNSATDSAPLMPMSRAPARKAATDQPSNGTLGSVARRSRSFSAASSIASSRDLLSSERRKVDRIALPLLEEHQQPVVGHALRVEDAIEVIALML